MNVRHTPAPWTLNENETAPCELIGNGTIHIADIYMTDFPAGKADSLLIAAAPELLAALRAIIKPDNGRQVRFDSHREYYVADIEGGELARAEAAIAKAEGQ